MFKNRLTFLQNNSKIAGAIIVAVIIIISISVIVGIQNFIPKKEASNPLDEITNSIDFQSFTFTDNGNDQGFEGYDDVTGLDSIAQNSIEQITSYSLYRTGVTGNGNWVLDVPIRDYGSSVLQEIYAKIPNWLGQETLFGLLQNEQTVIYNNTTDIFLPIEIGNEHTRILTIDGEEKWFSIIDGQPYVSDPDFINQARIVIPNFEFVDFNDIYGFDDKDTVWLEYNNEENDPKLMGKSLIQLNAKNIVSNPATIGFVTSSGLSLDIIDKEVPLIQTDILLSQLQEIYPNADEDTIYEEAEGVQYLAENPRHSLFPISDGSFLVQVVGFKNHFFLLNKTDQSNFEVFALEGLEFENSSGVFVTCQLQGECKIVDMIQFNQYTVNPIDQTVVKEDLPESFKTIQLSILINSSTLVGYNSDRLLQFNEGKFGLWYQDQVLSLD